MGSVKHRWRRVTGTHRRNSHAVAHTVKLSIGNNDFKKRHGCSFCSCRRDLTLSLSLYSQQGHDAFALFWLTRLPLVYEVQWPVLRRKPDIGLRGYRLISLHGCPLLMGRSKPDN
jgi:hypothetical protein